MPRPTSAGTRHDRSTRTADTQRKGASSAFEDGAVFDQPHASRGTGSAVFQLCRLGERTTDESTSVLSTRIASAGKTIHKETSRQLQIGTTVYRLDRGVGRRDGGRPWVREHGESSHGTPESDSLVPPAQQLAKAESIVESPGSVDGQPVTKFTATFAPGAAPPSAALPFSGTESCPRTVSITMSFAPSGLPVLTSTRAEYLTEGHPMTATETIHLLATNFHFKPLKSPPVSKTISAASLERLRKSERSKAHRRNIANEHRAH